MVTNASAEFKRRILAPELSVNSGVYTAVDPSIKMRLNVRGEYEYYGSTPTWFTRHSEDLLAVSAFGGESPTEAEIAEQLFPSARGVTSHPVIGRYRSLYAGYAAEGDYREHGSSGGLTTWLLTELLDRRLVDGVIHVHPTPGEETLFGYRVVTDAESIKRGAKSRYYPANLSEVLREIAAGKKRYAVTAIPSFAYELRLLQLRRPEFVERIPFIIGLICGHQKSANYAKQLAWRAGIAPQNLRSIDFRAKDPEQPANKYFARIRGQIDGQEVERRIRQGTVPETDWGLGLFKSRFSDYTEDAFNETADAVFGDAWIPAYVGDSAGTNVVISRNATIDGLITEAEDARRIQLEPLSEADLLESQLALVRHSVIETAERFRILAARGEYVPNARRSAYAPSVGYLRRRLQGVRVELSRASHDAWVEAERSGDIGVFDAELGPLLVKYRRLQQVGRLRSLPRRVFRKLRGLLGN